MNFYIRFIIFLLINFAALGIGTVLMDNGPQTDWYIGLEKAPWTPPGWVFGFAWTTVMICFSLYMTKLSAKNNSKSILILFTLQFVLNISWNYVFFSQHMIALGMINLVLLLTLITYITFTYKSQLKAYTVCILPYLLWLIIANSLNGYILFNN